jgi:iron complex outermembrane receptor protein
LISLTKDPVDDLLVFQNTGDVEAKGIEIELDGKWSRGIETRLSYTLQEVRDGETGSILTNSPRHMAKLNVIAPVYKDLIFAGADLRYLSSRKTLGGNDTGDCFVANLTLFSRNLLKGLEISASVYNLFDREFGDPGSEEHLQDIIMQDGRTFRVKLTYSF